MHHLRWLCRFHERHIRRVAARADDGQASAGAHAGRVHHVPAANLADEAQSWIIQPEGPALRMLPDEDDTRRLFNCHRFFMENPSLSGRGSAGAHDVPELTHGFD
jgi:hypothetical protein